MRVRGACRSSERLAGSRLVEDHAGNRVERGPCGDPRPPDIDDRLFALTNDARVHFGRGLQREGRGGGDVLAAGDDRNAGKPLTDQLDEPTDLGPVLREHAADANQIGGAGDPLDDLLAAQADGHHRPVEERRDLRGILAESVDDADRVAGLSKARCEIRGTDRGCQGTRVRPRRHEQRRPEQRNCCHSESPLIDDAASPR